jgi:flagellar basal-body rod protein FlgB
MADPMIVDNTMQTVKFALDGLAKKQEMIGHNLSNADTPGYRAQNVNFEGALNRALQGEASIKLAVTNSQHMAATSSPDQIQVSNRLGGSSRADGNNVDIDVEMTQMSETVMKYMTLSQLISKKFLLLRNIAVGR